MADPFGDKVRQRRAVDQLHHERADAMRLFEPVDLRDVRMIERSQDLRFPFEAGEPFRIGREGLGQDFDGNVAMEFRVRRPIHLAHAARANERDDLVGAEANTGRKRHRMWKGKEPADYTAESCRDDEQAGSSLGPTRGPAPAGHTPRVSPRRWASEQASNSNVRRIRSASAPAELPAAF